MHINTSLSSLLKPLYQSVAANQTLNRSSDAPGYLFLLSHMRSYSSLLAHILGSHADIDGYGEAHVKYRNKLDFWRLRRAIQRATGEPIRGEWLLDKILHNYVRAPDRLIDNERVRAIIFLRRPERTLQSILTLARHQHADAATHNAQLTCDYYVSRLHRLRADGQRLGKRSLYFDAEAFIEQPQMVLDQISDWLQLSQPLQSNYQVLKRTGETGFGDPLHNIRAGHILDSGASTIDAKIQIPAQMLREAEAAYQRCREMLLQECQLITHGICQ